ncbi:hypothetical protein B0H94_11092 [Salsuginibacillus halophilus]|uniref:Uncharacterized protein n=1 Tax=Salsuginibacillus halophilus TaxID=517424 RepID=A0A2P8HBM5_9BACI|nr:hypothetical protein [Salsuginibacillus halophilus]PSL43616.1 hypothetical protein B0H94_11092 [Salsuginibacillus halophilus]
MKTNELKQIFSAFENQRTNQLPDTLGEPSGQKLEQTYLSVTATNHTSSTYTFSSCGSTSMEALKHILHKYINTIDTTHFTIRGLKLDFILSANPYENFSTAEEAEGEKLPFKRGTDGLAFGNDLAYVLLPEEVRGHDVLPKKVLSLDAAVNALNEQVSTPALVKEDLQHLPFFRIRRSSYYVDPSSTVKLRNGLYVHRSINADQLRKAIEWTNRFYFQNIVKKDGSFIYTYDPALRIEVDDYNMLRHAGTAYSMLETYEITGTDEVFYNAERALEFLAGSTAPVETKDGEGAVLLDEGYRKLGGNGLAMVALAKYTELTNDDRYLPLMRKLGRWIIDTMDEEGKFTIHKQRHTTGEVREFESLYYPGEAMLGLLRLQAVETAEDTQWKDAAAKASRYIIHVRDKDVTKDTVEHDHWQLYALNDLHKFEEDPIFQKQAYFIANAIMSTQMINEAKHPSWIGGFTVPRLPPEPTSTACRSEGLSACWELATRTGDDAYAKRLLASVQASVRFQLQFQLRPGSIVHYKDPLLTLGAVQRTFASPELRIDYTQHNISSFCALYQMLNRTKF